MSNIYSSKYPNVLIDKRGNSVNQSLQKRLTIEEYYDLVHHTHNMSDIVMDIGEGEGNNYTELMSSMSKLNDRINQLVSTVETQQKTIEDQKKTIESLTQTVEELKDDIINTPSIDWDPDTPGIQDLEGDTLGDLDGFQMTEIQ